MSLFKSVKKYEKESEQSVEKKRQLLEHEGTFPAVMKVHEANLPKVEEIENQLASARRAGKWTQGLYDELSAKRRRLQAPLQNYKTVQADLERELESLTRPFIAEEIERLESETTAVLSQKVSEEIRGEPNEKGTFTLGKGHLIRTNLAAIKTFREKMVENCNELRDMVYCSIPQIQGFIEKTEGEMRTIDLTPTVITLDAKEFMEFESNSAPEPGKTEVGYIPPHGEGIIPKNPSEQEDHLIGAYSDLKRKIK